MNYIYDVYLNFNKNFFDFYEWNDDDKINHIKKIPIIRISTPQFKNIVRHHINLKNNFLQSIKKRTEIYNNYKKLNCLILTDTKNVIAFKFNNKGYNIETSSLLLKDEFDILQYSLKLKEINMEYDIINKINYITATRKEYETQNYILQNINHLSNDMLKYLYYEFFNKEEKNEQIIKEELIKQINTNPLISNNIYNILNSISTN